MFPDGVNVTWNVSCVLKLGAPALPIMLKLFTKVVTAWPLTKLPESCSLVMPTPS